jgi:anti-sigma factor RsiW
MSTLFEPGEEELHAFIDGELDPARRDEVELRLASDTDLAARVEALRRDKEALARIYGPLIARSLPAELIEKIESHGERRADRLPLATLAALAASLVLLAIGTAVMRPTAPTQGDTIVAEALAARDRTLQPGAVGTIPVHKLVIASALISKNLAMKIKAPDLSGLGYLLEAVQIYPTAQDRAVELVYRDDRDREFSLFVRRSPGQPRFDVFERDGMRVCVWQDDVVSTVMAGQMSAAEMQRLASLAYNGLSS